ncbi:MAG: glycine cleavage system aminomethyltransferase GcvT [Elusimicrobiota bacterium]
MEKKTIYYDILKEKGGHFVSFANWQMPVFFSSIKDEHNAVRKDVGIFDISHMGNISIRGKSAAALISKVITNDINSLNQKRALYSIICNESGGIIDDIIVYKFADDNFLVIANASNISAVFDAFNKNNGNKEIIIENKSDFFAGLAIQGPNSHKIINELFDNELTLDYFECSDSFINSKDIIIARTGYTGEPGYELWIDYSKDNNLPINILNKIINSDNVTLCGLGARDILRLEAGYPLYGHELNLETNPFDAGLGWTIKLNEHNFIGKDALVSLASKSEKLLVGCVINERIVPRQGCIVYKDNIRIGQITSGSFSYSINKPVALAYIYHKFAHVGTNVAIEIRGKKIPAEITKPRFYYNPEIKKSFKKICHYK